jgi:prepilin-type processing-associated H-X9-DG protein
MNFLARFLWVRSGLPPGQGKGRCRKRTPQAASSTACEDRLDHKSTKNGFTLIDLLALLAVGAVLAVTILPALAGSRTKSESVRCLSNLNQIMDAMLMYTHDNHDFFPPNPDDGTFQAGYHWCTGFVGISEPQEFNPDFLANPSYDLILNYIGTNISLFRCTADSRTGEYQGTNASLIGTIVPAARTISMSGAVGTVDPQYYQNGSGHSGKPIDPVNGPWLTGSAGGNRHNNPWRTYGRTSDMVIPIPARLMVVTEENPWSINDASFQTSSSEAKWIDWASTLHNGGCVLTFGDGHVELHKWVTGTLTLNSGAFMLNFQPNNADWIWLTERTSAAALALEYFYPPDN